MNRLPAGIMFIAVVLLTGVLSMSAQAQMPRIFFTDIQSGPASGGEGGNGAYVTLYGSGFGSTQSSSTVSLSGSTAGLKVVSWGTSWLWYQKIVVQLLPSAASGNISVSVNGQASNGIPFTVRAGNIYCVSTSGSDSNSGKFPSCWRTIPNAKNSMAPGDVSYIENGVTQTALDNYNSVLSIGGGNATAANPIALVAYPGATVTISSNLNYTVRTPAITGSKDYWVLAGLTLIGADALDLVNVNGWRFVGNNVSCPNGSGQTACVHTDTTTNMYVLGNYVHNVGDQNGAIDKYYHAVYFTTNSNHIWMGWNEVAPNPNGVTTSGGCRAVQFYSTSGSDQFDLHVHDNRIHDAICDGINFSTVDPSKGTVEAYNNVIYHVGTGPDPADGSSNYTCVNMGGSGSGTTPADVYNNTMYDCGSRGGSDAGGISLGIPTRFRNNVMQQLPSETYAASSSGVGCSVISGSNNLWYGASNASFFSCLTANTSANPMFVSTSSQNFQVQSGSPAIDGGTSISGLTTDIAGSPRPMGNAFDMGAYEFGAVTVARPAAPTNLQVVVH